MPCDLGRHEVTQPRGLQLQKCVVKSVAARARRWEPEMEQAPLSKTHWRKSAQWSSLIRKHAQLVADDTAVADIFAQHCRVGKDKRSGREHKCIADEVRAAALAARPASLL